MELIFIRKNEMKITKSTLRRIIKEELDRALNEAARQAGSLDVYGIRKVIGQAAQPLIDKYGERMVLIALPSSMDSSNLAIYGPDGYTGIDMPLQDFKDKGYMLTDLGNVRQYVQQKWKDAGYGSYR
jgi:hypothetical protein